MVLLIWIFHMLTNDPCWCRCIQRATLMMEVHCSLLQLLFSIQPHTTHIWETWPPAGRGSAQRRLQTVRRNSHPAPSCLPSPSNPSVSHVSLARFPGTHHSSSPLLASSFCHLIQITELASVSFVRGSILPGRWTGGEKMDSHRGGGCVYVCVCEMEREREGGGEK